MGLTIAIDGIFLANSQPGGYKTYTDNLVRNLQLVDSENAYRLLVDSPVDLPKKHNWRVDMLQRKGSVGYVWREQVGLVRYARREQVDLFHFPCATAPLCLSQPYVVTIHDTIELTEPLPSPRDPRRWAMRFYSRLVQSAVAKRARLIITVSEHSRQAIASHLDIPLTKIVAVHEAPAEMYRVLPKDEVIAAAKRIFVGQNYILAIASAAPRKNTWGLLQAYSRLPVALRRKYPLLFVCTHNGVQTHIQTQAASIGLTEHVFTVVNVSDADLLALYNAASLFAFPSLSEGFGLPPLEAMACGTPVVALHTSCIPEILGDAAMLVNPYDLDALTAALVTILSKPDLAADLSHRGLSRARQFSWQKTARQTLSVYQSLNALRNT